MPKRTFYISNSGSDSNDGRSETAPWKSLQKVSEQVFKPGDAILLKSGDIWEEAVEIRGQGEPLNPIVFSSYGEGDKPIIRYDQGDVVKAVNIAYLTIQGLHIQCITDLPLFPESDFRNFDRNEGKYALNRGIYLEFTGSETCEGIVIADNVVNGPGADSFTEGVSACVHYPAVPNNLQDSVVTGLLFEGNTVHGFGWIGLVTTGARDGESDQIWFPQCLFRKVSMLHNTVFDIGVQGLLLCHAESSVMKWNTVHHAGMYKGPGVRWSPAGLWVWSARNVDLMFNEVYEMQDSDSGHDATGFDIDWHSAEIRVKYNHAHNNDGNGIVTMACRDSEISGNRIEGNHCVLNCGKGQIGLTNYHGTYDVDRISSVENLNIHDNLIIIDREDTGALNSLKISPGPEWAGNAFKGNRVVLKVGVTPAFLYEIKPEAAVNDIGDNVYYGFPEKYHLQGKETDRFEEITPHPPLQILDLSAEFDVDAGTVELRWAVDEAAGGNVHHYNIHKSTAAHFKPAYTNMIGQSKGLTFTDDDGLDLPVYYIIQAEDLVGEYGPVVEIEVR